MGSSSAGLGLGWPGFTALLRTLFNAGGAGACLTQPRKAPRAAVSVGPIDLETFTLGEQNPHFFRRDRNARQWPVFCALPLPLVFRLNPYALVAHEYSLQGTGVTGIRGTGLQVYELTSLSQRSVQVSA